MTVRQEADRAVMDWQEFSIGVGHSVHFEQEAHQAILNRVMSDVPSEIFGELTADGAVWLMNPNGVLIGQGAVINTRSFLATTLHINEDDFLTPGISLELEGSENASVINEGSITASNGSIVLIARHVDNQGELKAFKGSVNLGAGNRVTLSLNESRLIPNVRVETDFDYGVAGDVGVNHEGIIEAAKADLVAAGGNIYSMAVNTSGSISAHGWDAEDQAFQAGGIYLVSEGGKISVARGAELNAFAGDITVDSGGNAGSITIAGKLEALSSGADFGGIHIHSASVNLATGADLNASGDEEGGLIEIRSADSTTALQITVEEDANLRANGEWGVIELEAVNLDLAGDFLLDSGELTLRGDTILGQNARIRSPDLRLGLSNGAHVALAGGDNAIESLTLLNFEPSSMELVDADAPLPRDFALDAGAGSLEVHQDGSLIFKNFLMVTDGDLQLSGQLALDATELAVLASREGGLYNESENLFSQAQAIRLYARDEGELGALTVDSVIEGVAYPDDPGSDARTVLYLSDGDDTPEQPPETPDPGQPEPPQPEEPGQDQGTPDPVEEQLRQEQNREQGHQQQQLGTSELPAPPPAAASSEENPGSAPGGRWLVPGSIYVEDGADGMPATIKVNGVVIVPAGGSSSEEGQPEFAGELGDEELIDLLQEALAQLERDVDEEGSSDQQSQEPSEDRTAVEQRRRAEMAALRDALEELQQRRREQAEQNRSGQDEPQQGGTEESQEPGDQLSAEQRLRQLLEQQRERGEVSEEDVERIIEQVGSGSEDREMPDIDRSAGSDPEAQERREQQRRQAEQRREEQRRQEERRRDEVADRNTELLNRIENDRRRQQEENERAREEAERRALDNLSEEQKRLLEERSRLRDQQQERDRGASSRSGLPGSQSPDSGSATWQRSPIGSPVNTGDL